MCFSVLVCSKSTKRRIALLSAVLLDGSFVSGHLSFIFVKKKVFMPTMQYFVCRFLPYLCQYHSMISVDYTTNIFDDNEPLRSSPDHSTCLNHEILHFPPFFPNTCIEHSGCARAQFCFLSAATLEL